MIALFTEFLKNIHNYNPQATMPSGMVYEAIDLRSFGATKC